MNILDFSSNNNRYLDYLKITDFENFFDIYTDKKGKYVYNLNNNLYLDIAEDSLSTFTVTYDSYWPTISYKLYNTTRLAWLLMKLNGVTGNKMFTIVEAGTKIIHISKDLAKTIVEDINTYER